MKFLTQKHQSNRPLIVGVLLIATLFTGANAYANEQASEQTQKNNASNLCKNSYSLISYELRPRSVPMFIKALEGDLAINQNQKQQLKTITEYVPKNVMPMRQKIKTFEQTVIAEFVENGKTPDELSAQLDKLIEMKRALAIEEIKVFNQLKNILSPEQYQTAIKNAGSQQ